MGKENDVLLSYLEDNERFADAFNNGFFEGRRLVNPKELQDASERYSEYSGKSGGSRNEKKSSQKTRDIKKRMKSGTELKILALESQSNVNYIMPWRCMDYDSREYGKQIREIQKAYRQADKEGVEEVYSDAGERLSEFTREDRIVPVYTLCVYHGEAPWDGPRSLKDMMNFGECDKELWEQYFANYPMRLLCVNELRDCSEFESSLGELFGLLPYRNDKKKLMEMLQGNPGYQHVDQETAEAISVLMGVEILMENKDKYEQDGGYNMCQAMRELLEDSRQEGINQGINQGISILIETCQEFGMTKEEIMAKVKQKYELDQSVAEEYMKKYYV